jgi:DNA-binding phage protein
VYDSPTDDSIPVVKNLQQAYPYLHGILNEKGRGVINALKAGVETARRKGKRLGRPPKHVDIELARTLLAEGASSRSIARKLGTSLRSLRRALRRQGEPSEARQNHPPIRAAQVHEITGATSLNSTRGKT